MLHLAVDMKIETTRNTGISKHTEQHGVSSLRFVFDLVQIIGGVWFVQLNAMLNAAPVDRFSFWAVDVFFDG